MRRTPLPGAAALAALLAACDGGVDTSELPLRLVVQPADSVAPGDSLRMTAHLVNPGRQPVRLEFEDQCQVEIYVQAPDKTVLHPAGGGTTCVGAPTALDLAPGDTVRFTDAWLVTSNYALSHTAYAVLWEHRPGGAAEDKWEKARRSNIVEFSIARPER